MTLLRVIFFYFLVYSFFGWIIEGIFNLYTKGRFIKPNFLYLPLKPMYGIASVLLVQLSNLLPFWLLIPCCFIIPTAVEYLTALWLLNTFNLRYWDYSQNAYQISGFICLKFCIYWGILSYILIFFIHPIIVGIYQRIYFVWIYLAPIFFFIILMDFLFTIRNQERLNVE